MSQLFRACYTMMRMFVLYNANNQKLLYPAVPFMITQLARWGNSLGIAETLMEIFRGNTQLCTMVRLLLFYIAYLLSSCHFRCGNNSLDRSGRRTITVATSCALTKRTGSTVRPYITGLLNLFPIPSLPLVLLPLRTYNVRRSSVHQTRRLSSSINPSSFALSPTTS